MEKIKLDCALDVADTSKSECDKKLEEEVKKAPITEISLADVKCFGKLGEGSGGIVEKAIHIPTRTKLALKVIVCHKG